MAGGHIQERPPRKDFVILVAWIGLRRSVNNGKEAMRGINLKEGLILQIEPWRGGAGMCVNRSVEGDGINPVADQLPKTESLLPFIR